MSRINGLSNGPDDIAQHCAYSVVVVCIQIEVFQLNPMGIRADTVGIFARIFLCACTLGLLCLLQWRSELASIMLFAIHIACFPMLNRETLHWLVGEDAAQLRTSLGKDVPEGDALSVILMVASAITFLVLIPVRITKGWVVPAMTLMVYFCWTLWLPESGLGSFVNRFTIGCALVCLCLVVLLGRAEVEMRLRCHFEEMDAAHNLSFKRNMRANNIECNLSPEPSVLGELSLSQPPQSASATARLSQNSPVEHLPNQVIPDDDNILSYSISNSSHSPCSSTLQDQMLSSSIIKDLRCQVQNLQEQNEYLELVLSVRQYMGQLGVKALAAAFRSDMIKADTQHWINTRTLIKSMEKAYSSSRSSSFDRHTDFMLSASGSPHHVPEVEQRHDDEQAAFTGGSSNASSLFDSVKQALNNMHTTGCDNHTSILLTGDSQHHMTDLEHMHNEEQWMFPGDSKTVHTARCDNHTSIIFGPDAQHHDSEVEQAHDEDQGRVLGNSSFRTSSLVGSLEQAFKTMQTTGRNRFSGPAPQNDISEVEQTHDEDQRLFPGKPSCSTPCVVESMEQEFHTMHTTMLNGLSGPDDISEVDHTHDEEQGMLQGNLSSTSSLVESLRQVFNTMHTTRCDNHTSILLTGDSQHHVSDLEHMHEDEQVMFLRDSKNMHTARCDNHTSIMFGSDPQHHVSQVEQTHEEDPAAFPGNSPFTTSSLMESLEQVFNSMHTAGHNTFSGPPSQCDIPEVEQTHDEDQRMFAGKSSCSAPCFVASMEQEFHTMHTTMLNRLSGPDDISEVDHTNDEEQGMLPGNSSSTSSLVRSLKQAFNTMHTTRCDNHTSILLTGDSHHHMSELEQMHHNEQGVFSGDSKIMHPTRCDNHTSIMFGPDAEHHAREVEQAHDEDQGRFPGNFNFSTSSLAESLEQAFNTMHTMRNNRFSGSDPQQDIPQVEHMHDEHQKIFPGIPSCSAPALAETF